MSRAASSELKKLLHQSTKALVPVWRLGLDLSEIDLQGEDLQRADLRGLDLRRADLRQSNLTKTDLSGADLFEADLSKSEAHEAQFHRTNLSRANLSEANLRGANLFNAKLCEAQLHAADLSGASLRGANLGGADLSGVFMSETNLWSAYVIDEQLVWASSLWHAVLPDGSRYNGRLNLPGDISWADTMKGIDNRDPAAMADFYGVSLDDYREGQTWAATILPKLRDG